MATSIQTQASEVKTKPIEREVRLRVLGKSTARCERCLSDCAGCLDSWTIYGLCDGCLDKRSDQQRRAGR